MPHHFHFHHKVLLWKSFILALLAILFAWNVSQSIDYHGTNFEEVGKASVIVSAADHQGHGSGVIINKAKGFILTNAHVATALGPNGKFVVTIGETDVPARVIWVSRPWKNEGDLPLDVALIKVDPKWLKNLSQVTFRFDPPRVGELVFAVGNPMSLRHVATWGRISGTYENGTPIVDINIGPGSSGGPLFDEHGKFIGLTTWAYPASFGWGMASLMGLSGIVPVSIICEMGICPA